MFTSASELGHYLAVLPGTHEDLHVLPPLKQELADLSVKYQRVFRPGGPCGSATENPPAGVLSKQQRRQVNKPWLSPYNLSAETAG